MIIAKPIPATVVVVICESRGLSNPITMGVGDITICKPPRRGRVTQRRFTRKKPKAKHEDGGSIKGLKPVGDLRPVVINRRNGMTCVVRQD